MPNLFKINSNLIVAVLKEAIVQVIGREVKSPGELVWKTEQDLSQKTCQTKKKKRLLMSQFIKILSHLILTFTSNIKLHVIWFKQ